MIRIQDINNIQCSCNKKFDGIPGGLYKLAKFRVYLMTRKAIERADRHTWSKLKLN